MGKNQFALFGAVVLGLLMPSTVQAQCSGGAPSTPVYYPPAQPVYYPPAQPVYAPPVIYPQPQVYPQPHRCPQAVVYPETIVYPPPSGVVEYGVPVPVAQPGSGTVVNGTIDVKPIPAPVKPWNQWADMPPLRGDFQTMIQQVTGDIDWMLTAQGEKFSPDVKSILVEAKSNLETSCRVCDEDPDLFAGVQPGGESVRNVAEQLANFRQLISKSLQQPSMQTLAATVAPARQDKSKVGSVMGALDGNAKKNLFGMFALETLGKRGDELLTHAKAVENGTFRPVGVDSQQQELKTGDVAPNFTVQTVDGNMASLSDYRGKKVVLVFNRGHF